MNIEHFSVEIEHSQYSQQWVAIATITVFILFIRPFRRCNPCIDSNEHRKKNGIILFFH